MDGGKNIIQTCIDHFGKIDILVNTAGNHIGGLIEEATEEQLDSLYQVHMKGHFACTQTAVKEMVEVLLTFLHLVLLVVKEHEVGNYYMVLSKQQP